MMRHYQITLEGDFQKKGYRFHTFFAAQTLGLSGSVCEKDDKIIIDAEGQEENLSEFILWCRERNDCQPIVHIEEKSLAYYNDFLIL